ncbi:MAG TPA: hypothetical protein VGF53_03165 [Pseudolabrys sp.]|jgi:hypothetical protein
MNEEKKSNELADKAAFLGPLRQLSWNKAMACSCSGRQIRHHLFVADLFAWMLIILAIVLVLKFG